MTFKQGLIYVLKNCWFWPWKLFLRPLDFVHDAQDAKYKWFEMTCSIIGSGLWGAISGILYWFLTGDIQGIWFLATVSIYVGLIICFLPYYTIYGIEIFKTNIGILIFGNVLAIIIAIIFNIAIVGIFGSISVSLGIMSMSKGQSEIDNTLFSIFMSALIAIFCSAISIFWLFLGIWSLLASKSLIFIIILCFFLIAAALKFNNNMEQAPDWVKFVFASLLSLLVFSAFALFPSISKSQVLLWSITLVYSASSIEIACYFLTKNSIAYSIKVNDLKPTLFRQTNWLILLWTLFTIPALVAWLPNPKTPGLNEKLDILALYLAIAAPLITGLPFYPFTSLISLWQCRSSCAKKHSPERFRLKVPFRWQTFAYPLPGLTSYLIRLAHEHGCETAFKAIQLLQFWSLQMRAGRLAILELAKGKCGLSFCGYVAVHCSIKTLLSISLSGSVARAVSVLRRKQEKEDEHPLELYAGDFPPKRNRLSWMLSPASSWIFIVIREQSLSNRIAYALEQLSKSDPIPDHTEKFRLLLNKLAEYAGATDLKTALSTYRPLEVIDFSDPETKWMTEGWSLITNFHGLLEELKAYRDLTTPAARKEFLNRRAESPRQYTWDNLPDYWASIGKELSEHWIHLLEEEAKQAKEWLKLEITTSQNRIATGRQELLLNITNPTGTLAKNVRIRMEDEPGIFWNIRQAQSSFLEGGKHTFLRIELETQQQGRFRIAGILEAEDLDDNPVKQPFAFSVEASERGKSYQIPQFQPYQVGEGLGDDRTFAGRIELIHELKSLWKQPGGKPAIALVGQRRIGKTSLLNKIARMGLEDIGLLPVLTDIQGIGTEYEFLKETARKMSEALGLPVPHIGQTEPFAEFRDVLLGMKSAAKERRILLMLDEADLIPAKRLGERVPDFLRSVMQSPEYPILLLFCGTHALSRMSRDQSSVLFNTVHFKTVSYLTKSESAEVLVKPAKDIIEFDPIVLDEAFRLTRGQPQLLQSLGMAMICNFNSVIFSGKTRSDYADLNDLNQAVETVLQQHNSAFTQHWEHADIATHRVLSALAWALDETNRPQMDIDGIEDMMRQTRLQMPRERTFRILEQLLEEEFLIGEGVTYRFAVPLYRRWIAWRWQPEKVRQEG